MLDVWFRIMIISIAPEIQYLSSAAVYAILLMSDYCSSLLSKLADVNFIYQLKTLIHKYTPFQCHYVARVYAYVPNVLYN